MKITKAVITAAGKGQRNLPLQTLIDRDGQQKSVLTIILDEVVRAGVKDICIVVHPDDKSAFYSVAGEHARYLTFVEQEEPKGYGHAILCAKDFVRGEPFLHLIGDHLFLSSAQKGCAQRVVEMAEAESCTVSAVQATREVFLSNYGAVSGKRVQGKNDLYIVDRVIEKPTPTEAEQSLIVPGLRAGFYLCFFGIHVLTPMVMEILEDEMNNNDDKNKEQGTLSTALQELTKREKYLALEMNDHRYNIGVKYGLLNAQLAFSLSGKERDQVISMIMEILLLRDQRSGERNTQ
ncbi:MAG TPA: sugar phosphate nucleotidyltransferase [Bacteroidota bacterium]|nr:sugar phosphate nucleotidyltransferase [Bacteroidota bacterium]